jgi:hypothetical protein
MKKSGNSRNRRKELEEKQNREEGKRQKALQAEVKRLRLEQIKRQVCRSLALEYKNSNST